MKKLILLCLVICTLSATACSSSDSSSKAETSEITTTTTTASPDSSQEDTTTTTVEGAIILGDSTEASTTTTKQEEKPDETSSTTTTTQAEQDSPGGFKASELYFEYKGCKIKLGDKYSDYKASLGEPNDIMTSPSCLHEGDDKTYIFDGVSIYTYPNGAEDIIYEVEVTGTDAVAFGGLKTGITLDDVSRIYGDDVEASGFNYTYYDGSVALYIYIEDGVVSSFGAFEQIS